MVDMGIIMVLFSFLADTARSLLEVRLFTITVVAGIIEMAVVTINVQHQGDTITTIQTEGLATTHVITRAIIIVITHLTRISQRGQRGQRGQITRVIQATGVALTAQVDLAFIGVT